MVAKGVGFDRQFEIMSDWYIGGLEGYFESSLSTVGPGSPLFLPAPAFGCIKGAAAAFLEGDLSVIG